MAPTPYTIHIPDDSLEQLRKKLETTRWPSELENSGWKHGVPLADVKRLAEHWRTSFDWRAQERAINESLPQFTTDVAIDWFGILNIHLVHKRSSRANAIPLLFCHGWPGSFLEVAKVLPLLTEPEEGPAFHVVAPSLPGYAFSQAPTKPGFGIRQYAEVVHKIMLELGYTQYVTQGGDWGSIITRSVGFSYAPEHCKGSHLNFALPPVKPPTLFSTPLTWFMSLLTPPDQQERIALARAAEFEKTGCGYFFIQSTRPQTIGYALNDSPIALLAWIYEKLHDWTDSYPWTDDEVLTWISIYWHSRAGPEASIRTYYEYVQQGGGLRDVIPHRRHAALPLGVSRFPLEILSVPRTWKRLLGNVVFDSTHVHGGHFASHEHPDVLVSDLRKMFGRGGGAFGVVGSADGY